jgi:hypothetical protein
MHHFQSVSYWIQAKNERPYVDFYTIIIHLANDRYRQRTAFLGWNIEFDCLKIQIFSSLYELATKMTQLLTRGLRAVKFTKAGFSVFGSKSD